MGQAWEIELTAGGSPVPDWRAVSQIQTADAFRLRVIGARPGETGRAVTPTLEEAYLVLMGSEIGER
jgi:hypothetical protein